MIWNKGLTGEEYKKHYKKGFGGIFKKGQKPWNAEKKEIYSEETRIKMRNKKLKDGYINKKGYKIITFFGKRKMEHRKVYEDNFGKIPEGFDIHHQDGNKLNNNLNNLHLMTKSEHTKLHWEEKII